MAQPSLRCCYACLEQTSESVPIIESSANRTTDELRNSYRGSIIIKHFWFKLEDLIDGYVCPCCWYKIEEFHQFYNKIEAAHKQQLCFALVKVKEEKNIVDEFDVELFPNKPKREETTEQDAVATDDADDDGNIPLSENEDDESCDTEIDDQPPIKSSTKPVKKRSVKLVEKLTDSDILIAQYCKLHCEECLLEFPNFSKLQKHARVTHKQKAWVQCCDQKYNNRTRLFDHIQLHVNPNQFQCEICNRACLDREGLKKHLRQIHTPKAERSYKCERCPSSFPVANDLSRHMRYHEALDKKQFQCNQCDKFFGNSSLLKGHIKNRHSVTFDFVCDTCAEGFNSRAAFLKHVQDHKGKIPEKIQCPICRQWMAKSGFKKHKLWHITTDSRCTLCGRECGNKLALHAHKHSVHREAKHACNVCGKMFKKPGALREHLASHSGEALYTCTHCPKTFNSSANMYSHRKKMHPQEWLELKMQRSTAMVHENKS